MASLLEGVNTLIEKKVGDLARLEHIKQSIENNKHLYTSDRDYLDSLIEKHLVNEQKTEENISTLNEKPEPTSKITETEKNSGGGFCGSCGKPINIENDFCPKCGSSLKEQSQSTQKSNPRFQKPIEWKSESTTLLLSILLGLFGIQGVGHLYVGKIGKGIGILIGSIILFIVSIALIATGIGAIAGVPLLIGYFVMFVWQILDSRNLCREYNQYLEQHQRPPEW